MHHLEEELDERRVELEREGENWKAKVQKLKDAEKIQVDLVKTLRGELGDLKSQNSGAKARVGELEVALKENQVALEGARAEIETLRVEAGVSGCGSRLGSRVVDESRRLQACGRRCKPPAFTRRH
jgi:chromosome segregation ATPase